MAKKPSDVLRGPSRIRFIMVDAEISDGDLGQVTQAIQNALRPPQAAARKAIAASAASADEDRGVMEAELVEEQESETAYDVAEQVSASYSAKAPRKPKTPKVLELDLTSEPSLAEFAKEKNPGSDRKRFLTVAAWFHLHRNGCLVTADHIYTAYRALKWPSAIKDFAQPLRDLKRDQLLEAKGKGLYAINHLGLAEVEKATQS